MDGNTHQQPVNRVTVTRKGSRFTVEFSQLAGQVFGPWGFAETVHDLRISALLDAESARNLVLTAHEQGSAWTSVTR